MSLLPLRDLLSTGPGGIIGSLLVFAALGIFAPMRFAAPTSVPRILTLGAGCSLIAEDAAETLLPFAEQRGITLDMTGGPSRTSGSAELLLRMVTNLVQNAIVHNVPAGGTVTVHTETHGDTSVLRVENTVVDLRRNSYRPSSSPSSAGTERVRTDEHAGVGLGLANVHSVARAHDGTLGLVPVPPAACTSRSGSPARRRHHPTLARKGMDLRQAEAPPSMTKSAPTTEPAAGEAR